MLGRFCQLTTDPCRLAGPGACYFGGTCQSVGDQYICHCAPGYTGQSTAVYHKILRQANLMITLKICIISQERDFFYCWKLPTKLLLLLFLSVISPWISFCEGSAFQLTVLSSVYTESKGCSLLNQVVWLSWSICSMVKERSLQLSLKIVNMGLSVFFV